MAIWILGLAAGFSPMICASCGHPNRDGARFCEECGGALGRVCASCKAELRPAARFCDACGQPTSPPGAGVAAGESGTAAGSTGSLASGRPAPDRASGEARKIVTILFADLAGSTALHEKLDPESVRLFMERYYAAMRGAVETHEGTVVKLLGDGVMAAFGVPVVAENDALRAVRAGMEMLEAFRGLVQAEAELVGDLGLRVGINTGEVVVSPDKTDIVGDPVNVAARLQQEARHGDAVIGESTQRLVGGWVTLMPLGRIALKGRSGGVKAFRVVSLDPPAGSATSEFVGRASELARITTTYEAAVESRGVRIAVLLGSPGLGKSRLIEEFSHRLDDAATVLRAHCDADGGATFAPLVRALREHFHLESGFAEPDVQAALAAALPAEEPDGARIVRGIAGFLTGSAATPEETFFLLRRLLGLLAQSNPVMLVIDDVHWAEPLLLDFIEHLSQWGSGLRLFVLLGARPELREIRSSLATPGGAVADVVTLSGLDAGAAMRLAANVIGAADLPATLAAKVLATSEGNPLFVGELVRMLVDEGAIERQGDRWVAGAGLEALEMPPTIHALLAARIERLRPEEIAVIERAAVMGRQFSRGAVAELLPRDVKDLDARLEALRRAELIERDTGWLFGEPLLRFHHVLIRDAAYRRLLKGTRAELHARLATWIESRPGGSTEHEEILGWHLEQAHQHLRELGPLDEAGRELGRRAAVHLSAAGRRALARDDVALAANLLGRAIERLEAADASRADLALDWCEALLAAGDVRHAAAAIAELEKFAADSTRLRAWHTCFAGQLAVMTEPQALQTASTRVAAAAGELATLDDAAGEAKAHFVNAQALARLGKVGACEAALDQALAAARKAGDRRRANAVLAGAPLAALWGPSPVTRASGRCLDVVRVLRITQGAPAVEAVALSCQGLLEALRGRTDAARRMIESARKMVEELGITHRLLETDVFRGRIDLLEGDAASAERVFRSSFDGLRELGHGIDAARAAALLGRALLAQNRADEAEAASLESEKLAGDDLQASIAWRVVRARARAQRGDHADAIEVAKKAVEIAGATDALLDHADARLALAIALTAAGRRAEGEAEERRAFELWEEKGATELIERTRTSEKRPAATAAPPAEGRQEVPPVRRHVRPNLAVKSTERYLAAILNRDLDALGSCFGESLEVTYHPTGTLFGKAGLIETWKGAFGAKHLQCGQSALATLGDSLVLVRQVISHDGLQRGGFAETGPAEVDTLQLSQVDEAGKFVWAEAFAGDRLSGAVVRLYERYAELMPEGAERERATSTARTVATVVGPYDLERYGAIHAPDLQYVDHRMPGVGHLSGAGAVRGWFGSLLDVAKDVTNSFDDVLALSPDSLLMRWTNSGIERKSGGRYERGFLWLGGFGPDGSLRRIELFDTEREAEALARFEELSSGGRGGTGSASTAEEEESGAARGRASGASRRLRANAASAAFTRLESAFASRDQGAVQNIFCASLRVLDHLNAAEYGFAGNLEGFRQLLRSPEVSLQIGKIAILGDVLSLASTRIRGSGISGGRFDIAEYEREDLVIFEADSRGRVCLAEIYPRDGLSLAIARLYERYAELMPEGPERERAATAARSFAGLIGRVDLRRMRDSLASSYVGVDHRPLGTWTTESAEGAIEHFRLQEDLAEGFTARDEDILALEPGGFLVRRTYFGDGRESGGYFENRILVLFLFGPDGRVVRSETWDAEQAAEALARFDELCAPKAGDPVSPSSAFENAASRADEQLMRCFNARDWEGVLACIAPEVVFDERRRLLRNIAEREIWLEQFRMMYDQPDSRFTIRLLATRGERLSLHRHEFTASVSDGGGPLEMDPHMTLHEVDAQGRIIAIMLFDLDAADAAYAELDARYETGEGRAGRAWGRMRELHESIYRRDREGVLATLAPAFQLVDHRKLGWGTTLKDPELFYRSQEAIVDLSPDFRYRIDHFEMNPRAFLIRVNQMGTREGGAFENPYYYLGSLDADGRFEAFEVYDLDQREEARARYEVLKSREGHTSGSTQPHDIFQNVPTRLNRKFVQAWSDRDWETIAAIHGPGIRIDDRRKLMQLETIGESALDQFRFFSGQPESRWEITTQATRGERLALSRIVLHADAGHGGGPLFIEYLVVDEAGEDERLAEMVLFDPGDFEAAYAELDARYGAGEGSQHPAIWKLNCAYVDAVASRDWAPVIAMCAPEIVEYDHRRIAVLGTTLGPEAWTRNFQTLVDLAGDTVYRTDHFRGVPRGGLSLGVWLGSRDGGEYELPLLPVIELNEEGRIIRADIYDVEQYDEARARFAELKDPGALRYTIPPIARAEQNRVVELMSRWLTALEAGINADQWDAVRTLTSPHVRFEDRQRLSLVSGDRDLMIESLRARGAVGARCEARLIGLGGDRVAVSRMLWSGGPPEGRFEVEYVALIEIDEAGLMAASILFDADAADAAKDEMLARWTAIDPAAQEPTRALGTLVAAFNARDPGRLRAAMADDIRVEDHRRTGMGRIDGAGACIDSLEALRPLAADTRGEAGWFWPAHAPDRGLTAFRLTGTLADGGAFESEYLFLYAVADGRIARLELFEMDALHAALGRFEELRPDPLRIPPNAATLLIETLSRDAASQDETSLHVHLSPDFVYDDRKRRSLVRGGVDEWLRALAFLWREASARPRSHLLATAGERLALHRVDWHEAADGARFAIENLRLVEIDDAGLIRALVLFDPEDEAAAHGELFERFAATGANGMADCSVRIMRALNDRDLHAVRSCFEEGLVVHDRRRTIASLTESAGDYLSSLEALFSLAPEVHFWPLYNLAVAPHGHVALVLVAGKNLEGGAFELPMFAVLHYPRGLISRIDLFDPEAVDAALARFEELRPDPLRVPPNAAASAFNARERVLAAGDPGGLRTLVGPEFCYDDRKRRSLVRGGVDEWVAAVRFLWNETGARSDVELVATAGDRLALFRVHWHERRGTEPFELGSFHVVEVDGDGLIQALVLFDPEDESAAHDELFERYVALGADGAPPAAIDAQRALNLHDLDRIRAGLCDDYVLRDHRRTGVGELGSPEASLASLRVVFGLTEQATARTLYIPAASPQGHVLFVQVTGIGLAGGPYESNYISVVSYRDGKAASYDIYEPEDMDKALARYREICAAHATSG